MAATPETTGVASREPGRLAAFARRHPHWPVLAVAAGLAARLLFFGLRQAGVSPHPLLEAFEMLGSLLVLAGLVPLLARAVRQARQRLLWGVRGKLMLSYVFIGVFPVLLVIVFFLLSGLLLFFNVSSYLVASSLRNLTEEARFLAQTTVLEIQKGGGPETAQAVLDRREVALASRYWGASIAFVPTSPEPCAGRGAVEQPASATAPGQPASGGEPGVPPASVRERSMFQPLSSGPWEHVAAPGELPVWIACSGFGGLIPYRVRAQGGDGTEETRLVIRGAALPDYPAPPYAVIVDIPLNEDVVERLRDETSVKLDEVSLIEEEGEAGGGTPGAPAAAPPGSSMRLGKGQATVENNEEAGPQKYRIPWVTFLEWVDWQSGRTRRSAVSIRVNIADVYDRLSEHQARVGSGGVSLGRAILFALVFVAWLFLIIEAVALVMGLALGRSITGSIQELVTGTEFVRRGEFRHRIHVRASDQLGALAASFNSMTASIEELLEQAAEKKRMEEELRIAREIQMSLLPRGKIDVPGLSLTALCVPAREVGGDYYDILRLDDRRLALLIADVAGKGTSAALYMAELKGVVVSLAKTCRSPRELLLQANRIISENLGTASFITMTYAVIDLEAGAMTYARAGHTPLIYRPAHPRSGAAPVEVLIPDGMVLGLQLDDGTTFERLLKEAHLPLENGDVLLFFTDGISEAMDEESDCFGDARLAAIVAEHGDLAPELLRERILREIEGFVGTAPQHDDMTLIIVKVTGMAAAAAGQPGRAVTLKG